VKRITEPVLRINGPDHQIQYLYAVNPGEYWQHGKFVFRPQKTASLIYEITSPSIGYRVEEVDIRDASTWKWINDLINKPKGDQP
jgi:hypothetical protein